MKLLVILVFILFSFSFEQAIHLDRLKLPPGFNITLYARVPNARQMSLSPSGILFVGSFSLGNVYAVLPYTKEVITIAKNIEMPVGVAYHNGDLYVSAVSKVLKYENIVNRLRNPPAPIVVATFPSDKHHGWKYIKINKFDRRLYVPVGAPCNICDKPDGSDRMVYARGIRNTVGFDWHPETKELWFTDNGRDNWGDDLPPDELNRAPKAGMHFGFPFCYGKDLVDPEFNKKGHCNDYVPAAYNLGPHVAALGMTFYTGIQFPSHYVNHVAFIAEHGIKITKFGNSSHLGSWNRKTPIGYRITTVDTRPGVTNPYQVFIDGWLNLPNGEELDDPEDSKYAWGRPVDVLQAEDGSLFISDDKAGAIYRVTYHGK